MAQGVRKCKVCGCEYPYCKTNRPTGVFRYQDVACCPEHASIYFARIAESRKKADGEAAEDAAEQTMSSEVSAQEYAGDEDDEDIDVTDDGDGEFDEDEDEDIDIETQDDL